MFSARKFRTLTAAAAAAGVAIALTMLPSAALATTPGDPADPVPVPTPVASASSTGPQSMYTPGLTTYPNASAAEPRAILLSHSGSANGTMLATFDNTVSLQHPIGSGMPPSLQVYRSTDGGSTWAPFSVVSDTQHGWNFARQGMMLELPTAMGDLAAGTILFAGNWGNSDESLQDIEVYASTDHGATWTYRSSCAGGTSAPAGIWEPFLSIDSTNNLNCFYSDGVTPGYSQFLGHVHSTDAGATWGAEIKDIAILGSKRPGMAAVVKMANGKYIFAHEYGGGTKNFGAYYKISDDGDDWGDPTDPGILAKTADGSYLSNSPELIAIPPSTQYPNGMLVMTAWMLHPSSGSLDAGTGTTFLVNTNNGVGDWQRAAGPFGTNPRPTATDCANYKPGLLWTGVGTNVLEIQARHIGTSPIGGGVCELDYGTAPVVPMSTSATPVATAVGPTGEPWMLWKYTDGHASLWKMTADGSSMASSTTWTPAAGATAKSLAIGADGKPRILWTYASGAAEVSTISSDGNTLSSDHVWCPCTGSTAIAISMGGDGSLRLLWSHTGGINLWTMPGDASSLTSNTAYTSPSGGTAVAIATGADNASHILWNLGTGASTVWNIVAAGTSVSSQYSYGPYGTGPTTNPIAKAISVGADGKVRMVWQQPAYGVVSLWTMPADASSVTTSTGLTAYPGSSSAIAIATGAGNQPRVLWSTTSGWAYLTTFDTLGKTVQINDEAVPS